MVKEAVEDGGGRGDITDEFAPVFNGPVGGHERGTIFVAAKNNLEEVFPGFGRQGFGPHIVNDEEIGFEILGECFGMALEIFVLEEVPHHVEYGAIEHHEPGADGRQADGLSQMGFAGARRADKKHIVGLADELGGGQFVDLFFGNGGVERPIKIFECFGLEEARVFFASLHQALIADVEFVLEDEFQELLMGEIGGSGLLQTDFQTLE